MVINKKYWCNPFSDNLEELPLTGAEAGAVPLVIDDVEVIKRCLAGLVFQVNRGDEVALDYLFGLILNLYPAKLPSSYSKRSVFGSVSKETFKSIDKIKTTGAINFNDLKELHFNLCFREIRNEIDLSRGLYLELKRETVKAYFDVFNDESVTNQLRALRERLGRLLKKHSISASDQEKLFLKGHLTYRWAMSIAAQSIWECLRGNLSEEQSKLFYILHLNVESSDVGEGCYKLLPSFSTSPWYKFLLKKFKRIIGVEIDEVQALARGNELFSSEVGRKVFLRIFDYMKWYQCVYLEEAKATDKQHNTTREYLLEDHYNRTEQTGDDDLEQLGYEEIVSFEQNEISLENARNNKRTESGAGKYKKKLLKRITEKYSNPSLIESIIDERCTKRQAEVLKAILKSPFEIPQEEIAKDLNISLNTFRRHLKGAVNNLGV